MGLTSAAEARLDARIRPDITMLRSRTPYPRRHRPALAVLTGGADRPDGAEASAAAEAARRMGTGFHALMFTPRSRVEIGATMREDTDPMDTRSWMSSSSSCRLPTLVVQRLA